MYRIHFIFEGRLSCLCTALNRLNMGSRQRRCTIAGLTHANESCMCCGKIGMYFCWISLQWWKLIKQCKSVFKQQTMAWFDNRTQCLKLHFKWDIYMQASSEKWLVANDDVSLYRWPVILVYLFLIYIHKELFVEDTVFCIFACYILTLFSQGG